MTHPTDDGVWRDEEKTPLSELNKAMASWDTDGQNEPNDNASDPGNDLPSTTGHSGPN